MASSSDDETGNDRMNVDVDAHGDVGTGPEWDWSGIPALVREPDLDVDAGPGPGHRLVVGDNLPAMTALAPALRGSVDVIYIDPPYNTGESRFVYRDSYSDSQSGGAVAGPHSGWLSFMRPRLELARDMLAADGVIYVSIDDHEQAYLRVLMDEVFGEGNFVAMMIVRKVNGSRQRTRNIATRTEYVLVYARDATALHLVGQPLDLSSYSKRDDHYERRGGYRLNRLERSSLYYTPTLDYPIEHDGRVYTPRNTGAEAMAARHANHAKRVDLQWRWGRTKFEWGLAHDFIVFRNGFVYTKEYARVDNRDRPTIRLRVPDNILDGPEYSSRSGTADMRAILGPGVFSYPKPLALLRTLVSMHPSRSAMVMDFFAGSGTTGQAVAALNAEDGGDRRCILITDGGRGREGLDIARDVARERMRRALTGEDWADNRVHPRLGGSLKVFHVADGSA